MNERYCCASVKNGSFFSPCSRKGVVEKNGRFYCRQHDPVNVKKRRDKLDKEQTMQIQKHDDNRICQEVRSMGLNPEVILQKVIQDQRKSSKNLL